MLYLGSHESWESGNCIRFPDFGEGIHYFSQCAFFNFSHDQKYYEYLKRENKYIHGTAPVILP